MTAILFNCGRREENVLTAVAAVSDNLEFRQLRRAAVEPRALCIAASAMPPKGICILYSNS